MLTIEKPYKNKFNNGNINYETSINKRRDLRNKLKNIRGTRIEVIMTIMNHRNIHFGGNEYEYCAKLLAINDELDLLRKSLDLTDNQLLKYLGYDRKFYL